MTAPSRGLEGFLYSSLGLQDDFLLDFLSVRESTVFLPENTRLWGDNKKGTIMIFEKFSRVGKCHIRSPLALIFVELEGKHEVTVVRSFGLVSLS